MTVIKTKEKTYDNHPCTIHLAVRSLALAKRRADVVIPFLIVSCDFRKIKREAV